MNEFVDLGNPFPSFSFPLVSCLFLCRKLHLFVGKSAKKLLPPELLFWAQICTKSFVGWGFAPDPTGGAYSSPDPLAVFMGLLLRGIGGGGEVRKEASEGRGGRGRSSSFAIGRKKSQHLW